MITLKDYNLLALKQGAIARVNGLEPVDFAWGRFSSVGLQEYKRIYTWDAVFKEGVKDEMEIEYMFYNIDLAMDILSEKIQENTRNFNNFMRQKLALEEIDLAIAGKERLSYKEMVHYRTFAGDEFLFRYGLLKAELNTKYVAEQILLFHRRLDDFKWSFDPDRHKGFYDELSDKIEKDLADRHWANRNRFFLKK